MKKIVKQITVVFFCFVFGCFAYDSSSKPVRIIFDTDFGNFPDDLEALILLNNLENKGLCNVLGIMASCPERNVIAAIDAVNSFYGNHFELAVRSRKYYDFKESHNRPLATQFTHQITNDDVPLCVEAYRKILSKQEDHSVVLIVIGRFGNLKNLLDSEPDQYSSLSGKELLNKKIRLISDMGGEIPTGKQEWNFCGKERGLTKYVLENIRVPIVFNGAEIGRQIQIGAELNSIDHHTPLYQGLFYFFSHYPCVKDRFYGELLDNGTYDSISVLYAVFGTSQGFWTIVSDGIFQVEENGECTWISGVKSNQSYLKLVPDTAKLKNFILDLLIKKY